MTIRAGLLTAFSLVSAWLSLGNARADVSITNPSFETLPPGGLTYETCGVGCSDSYNVPIPGWTSGINTGQWQPGSSSGNFTYFNYVPNGLTVAFSNGGPITQTVGATVVAGDIYTLSVFVGDRSSGISGQSYVGLIVNGYNYRVLATPSSPGTWADWTATYTGTATDAGDPITIELLPYGNGQGDYDNVTLTQTSATPEPRFDGLLALGLGGLMLAARLRHAKQAV